MTSCSRCESTIFWAPFFVGQSQFGGKRSYLYPGEEMSMGRAIFVCDSVSLTQPLIHWSWSTQLWSEAFAVVFWSSPHSLYQVAGESGKRAKNHSGQQPVKRTTMSLWMVLSGRAHLSRCSFLVGYLKCLFGRCAYRMPSLSVGCFECCDCWGSKRIRQKSRVTDEHLCFFDSHVLRNS